MLKKSLWILSEFSEIYQNEIKQFIDKEKLESIIREIKPLCSDSDFEFIKYTEEVLYIALYQ
jgi:hypothetical protein